MKFIRNEALGRPELETYKNVKKLPLVIVLDNVRSGMNTGSVFRSADAFLVEKIYCCGITAFPPDKEVLKTALGATESVDWEHAGSTSELLFRLKRRGYRIYAVEQSDTPLYLNKCSPDKNEKYVLVFGHEVKGVDENLIPLCDGVIEIPQSGTKHSINVSVCAGIILWEFYRILHLQA